MNNFAYIGLHISVGMLAAALLTKLAFLIPLEVHQAKVTNGLARLRKQLLIKGIVLFLINILLLFSASRLIILFEGITQPVLVASIFLALGSGVLIIAIIDYQIYHQNYQGEKTMIKDVGEIKADVKEVKKDMKVVKKEVVKRG